MRYAANFKRTKFAQPSLPGIGWQELDGLCRTTSTEFAPARSTQANEYGFLWNGDATTENGTNEAEVQGDGTNRWKFVQRTSSLDAMGYCLLDTVPVDR